MRVGLALPQFDFWPDERPLTWAHVVATAVRAEALGFGSLWLADHLFWSLEKYGGVGGPYRSFEPIGTLAALSRLVPRVRMGPLVLCAQLRPPTVLAKKLATLDILSEGRLDIGLGAGWYRPEFEAAGIAFEPLAVRHEQLAETIEIVTRLFAGDHVTFAGRHYAAEDARFLPHPVQRPRPPIVVGGRGDRLLDLVARAADGWNTAWTVSPAHYRQRLAALDAACERHGRDPASVERSVGLICVIGENDADVARRFEAMKAASHGVVRTTLDEVREGWLVGTPDQVRVQLEGWRGLGVSTVIVNLGALPFSLASVDDLELVAAAFPEE